jgi:hypothetical protein
MPLGDGPHPTEEESEELGQVFDNQHGHSRTMAEQKED